ncbi:DUF2271 domain-containing protein [Marinospirillum insulare]|uniref:DUF2271 domain-containing protein n=1 Tax=Marinospirillum insulare TaxID=217169 RepID=A0ABQ6A0E5_9GAMM|nr:DUF2271 domain-containing protein [Marinospirillum insulare]GLR63599.1 hypothetical protein GCM10007878_10340 [Marinospirillum insulare]
MSQIKKVNKLAALLLVSTLTSVSYVSAAEVSIEVNLPASEGSMNYRPYVAVWVEDENDQTVKTVAVWRKEADWLKDMRRWWRKAGRYDQGELDSVTGATRRPGKHQVIWDATNQQGEAVPAGDYTLNIEASREHGSRSWVRQTITLGGKSQNDQVYTTKAAEELGSMTIKVTQ